MRTFWISSSNEDSSGIAGHLVQIMIAKGWTQVTNYGIAKICIHTEFPRIWSKVFWLSLTRRRANILLRFEPRVVNPLTYGLRVKFIFKCVITLGAINSGRYGKFLIKWPYLPWPNPARPDKNNLLNLPNEFMPNLPLDRDILCSMIASRKFAFFRGGNYRLRNEIVSYREFLGIAVFGMRWNTGMVQILKEELRIVFFFLSQLYKPGLLSLFKSILESPPQEIYETSDKFSVLKRSEFSIIIENSNTYVSEKILDALLCGSIPIYKGPDLDLFGFPDGVYLNLPGNITDLKHLIHGLSDYEKRALRDAGEHFVKSQQYFSSWTPLNVAKDIIHFLGDELDE